MRRNLQSVPVFIPAGRIPAETADRAVAAGRAHSLRGKACLIISRVALEEIVEELGLDPEAADDVIRLITRGRRAVIARRSAGTPPQEAAR